MKATKRILLGLGMAATALVLSSGEPASAAPGGPAQAAQKAKRYRKPAPGTDVQAGCAHVTVNAPTDVVRKVVLGYGDYSKFIKRYKNNELQFQMKTKVVGRHGDKTDVYLEVPIMKGTAKVWGIVRFDPPRTASGEEVVEGRMLKGNVERLEARWRIRKIDDANTRLDLELLILPKIPLPGQLITGELEFVSDVSVSGARTRAEQTKDAK
jgi:hypothetical protein